MRPPLARDPAPRRARLVGRAQTVREQQRQGEHARHAPADEVVPALEGLGRGAARDDLVVEREGDRDRPQDGRLRHTRARRTADVTLVVFCGGLGATGEDGGNGVRTSSKTTMSTACTRHHVCEKDSSIAGDGDPRPRMRHSTNDMM